MMKRSTWFLLGVLLAVALAAGAQVSGLRRHDHSSAGQGGTLTAANISGTPRVLARGSGNPLFTSPGNTSENTAVTYTLPAGTLGTTGTLRVVTHWQGTSNANAKNVRVRMCGAAGAIFQSLNNTSASNTLTMAHIWAQSSNTAKRSSSFNMGSAGGGSGTDSGALSADTSVNCDIVITLQLSVGTDSWNMLSYLIELLPGP